MKIGDYVQHVITKDIRGKITTINLYSATFEIDINHCWACAIEDLCLIENQSEIHDIKLELSGNKLWK